MGCIHVYCGSGKGKTTAAVGLAVRFAGRGGSVIIARFLKNDDSGEVRGLRTIPGIRVIPCRKTFGFTWQMSGEQRKEAAEYYRELFREAAALSLKACGPGEDGAELPKVLLVLDEFCGAVHAGLMEEGELLRFLDERPGNLEVAVTGRDPSEVLLDRADYVTEMKMVKHPYQQGIRARAGIEY